MITEGRSDETSGEVSRGASTEGLMDDDRSKMVVEDSIILTSRVGMSMGVGRSSGFTKAERPNKVEVNFLCLASNWRNSSKEEQYSSRWGQRSV